MEHLRLDDQATVLVIRIECLWILEHLQLDYRVSVTGLLNICMSVKDNTQVIISN